MTAAMILAAGKGTRMGEMSARLPKPLVPVLGRTLLDRALDRLDEISAAPVVVNVHHLADQMEAHLAPRVAAGKAMISDERDALLETGGGVKKALPMLGDAPFLVINSDALWLDAPGEETALTALATAFDPARMDALLLLVATEAALGYEGTGDFFAGGDPAAPALLRFRGEAPSSPFMYGGIMMTSPAAYEDTPDGAWSNSHMFRRAAGNGRLFGLRHRGDWMHVGSPEGVRDAEARLLALGRG